MYMSLKDRQNIYKIFNKFVIEVIEGEGKVGGEN